MFERLIVKIAKTLDKARVPYMVIGGQAVLLYGLPRLTEDIDITLGVDTDKSDTIKKVIKSLGIDMVKGVSKSFIKKTNVLPAIDKKTGIRVDFIFSFLEYERRAINRATKVKLFGYFVNFAAPEDVIIHKVFAGRPRDLEDAKNIIIKNFNKINTVYIKRQLKSFSNIPEFSNLFNDFRKILKDAKV